MHIPDDSPDTAIPEHTADVSDDWVDFDEWAALFARDPDAFERRRRALLIHAMAGASDRQREQMSAVLDAYDERVSLLAPAARLEVAMGFAMGSLKSLKGHLNELNGELLAPDQTNRSEASETTDSTVPAAEIPATSETDRPQRPAASHTALH